MSYKPGCMLVSKANVLNSSGEFGQIELVIGTMNTYYNILLYYIIYYSIL